MPQFIKTYVRWVDMVSIYIGKVAMYSIFALTGLLIYATISRTVFNHPLSWAVEMGEFMFSAYYFLGGAYVILLRGHVRMDVFYSKWKKTTRATTDVFTDICLITYLIILLIGGTGSTIYAIQYQQVKRSVWAPLMWPIKVIIMVGILLVLAQAFSILFKDIAKARGLNIEQHLEGRNDIEVNE